MAFMHLVHILARSPDAKRAHCKLGFCVRFTVGLYFPLSFTLRQTRFPAFEQIAHCLIIVTV